jgi:curved DNA-binding protein CbpA
MNWPCHRSPSKLSSHPTPYDIFELEKHGVYSKQKFYELVKIYHPDRQKNHQPEDSIHHVPPLERLERYRLVVQAHTILSDPIRRRAYDTTGAGWGGQAYSVRSEGRSHSHTSHEPDSPFANATWEDWERWYARTSPHPRHGKYGPQSYEGTYINPNAFASFVILIAVISGVLQATHAGQYTGSIEEKAQAFTAKTNQFMSERKVDNTQYSSSGFSGHGFGGNPVRPGIGGGVADGRIRHFLERRDPSRYGLKDEEEDTYKQHFAGQPLLPAKGMVRERAGTASETEKHE